MQNTPLSMGRLFLKPTLTGFDFTFYKRIKWSKDKTRRPLEILSLWSSENMSFEDRMVLTRGENIEETNSNN